jgi:hypothetical protein
MTPPGPSPEYDDDAAPACPPPEDHAADRPEDREDHAADRRRKSEKITQHITVNFKRESELSDAQREVVCRMRFTCGADGNDMYVKKVRCSITYQMTMTARGEPRADGDSSSE